MDSMSTQQPFPNVSLGSQAKPQGPRRSSLVTHLVAHSRQFSPPGHLQAFAVSYSSEHRFALSRQRVRFRDALVSLIPPVLPDGDPFPGSLLSLIATLASPGTFIWSRVIDTASSITDRHALEINARVERWTSRRGPSSWKAGAPDYPVALSREPLLSRNLEGQRSACGSFQPISSSACSCNHSRRGGPACLSQTVYRSDAGNGCAYHSISR